MTACVQADARAEIRRNVVEHVQAWGISVRGGAQGAPWAIVEDNAVAIAGACGITFQRQSDLAPCEEPVRITGNALVITGRNADFDRPDRHCVQVAVDLASTSPGTSV